MIKFPKGAPLTVKQHLWEGHVRRSSLQGITRSEARLHKIILWTKQYGYQGLIKLGNFSDGSGIGWQNPKYDRKYIRHFGNFYLEAFVNPNVEHHPWLIINIYPQKDISPKTYKKFLNQLNSSLPGLKVSSVEYAVDLFCKSPDIVRGLFKVIIKYIYIPHQRKIDMIKNKKNKHSNRLYRIGKSYKVYERGKDNRKQKGKGWHTKDLDRVRFEYTANRGKLKEHGIDTLKDLIDDPKFIHLKWEKYLFRYFNFRKRLHKSIGPYERRFPAPYEPYRLKVKNGVSGTFHSEYFVAKNKLKNVSPYLRQPYFLNELESLLYEAMGNFGIEWRGA